MQERYRRTQGNSPISPHRKTLPNIMIAVPFVVCFSIFGIFNLVGGTILTIMSCQPVVSQKALELLRRLAQSTDLHLESQIDPMQVVGIMLLLTGSLLVIIGVGLGFTACRSVDDPLRRKRLQMGLSTSGLPMYSLPDRSSRRNSSVFSTSFASSRGRTNGKRSLEKTVSPILEVNGEDEIQECETVVLDVHRCYGSSSSIRQSPKCSPYSVPTSEPVENAHFSSSLKASYLAPTVEIIIHGTEECSVRDVEELLSGNTEDVLHQRSGDSLKSDPNHSRNE